MNRYIWPALLLITLTCDSAYAQLIRYNYSGTLVAETGNQLGLDGRSFSATAVVDVNTVPSLISETVDFRMAMIHAESFHAEVSGLPAEPTPGWQGIWIQDAINPGSAEALILYNSTMFVTPSGVGCIVRFPGILLSHDVFSSSLRPVLVDQSDVLGSGTMSYAIAGTDIWNDRYRAEDIQLTSAYVPEPSSLALCFFAAAGLAALRRLPASRAM